ncbi:MAG TPA: hypothetical protein VGE39_20030 [Prosthecobacter sp.]
MTIGQLLARYGQFFVLGGSFLWIMLCMRFWWVIDRDNVWQRRFIAIGAGVGGGLIYLVGTMIVSVLKEAPPVSSAPAEPAQEIRVSPRPATGLEEKPKVNP